MQEEWLSLEKRYEELEQLVADPEVISDQSKYSRLARELSKLSKVVPTIRQLKKAEQEAEGLEVMLAEKHDRDFEDLAKKELEELKARKAKLEQDIEGLLTEEVEDVDRDIMVEIRAGTGGQEASMFAADLYRMYTKYAARKNWIIELMESHSTDLDGFKEIVFGVKGKGASKRLQFESGVHRVQRVPETEAGGRIHTSTATVAVMVEPEDVELTIDPNDLKIDTYRSSGPGGQHMQKSDSAVRITHKPTGMVVACQDERSQLKNKNKALRVLRARLLDQMRQDELAKHAELRKAQVGSGDRSEKIRTYNFPDRRITDHRINFTTHQLEAVLDGDLDELSDALIKAAEEKKREAKQK
ncbi:MAG: peptide chain release factor 1 [Candidatus Omnitrophica bacterium]|nr:peptide chain release factor 1 [Candidatus Omnitrophota bacterium]